MCGGDVKIPEATPEERELISLQTEMLRNQQDFNSMIIPMLLEESGYELVPEMISEKQRIQSQIDDLRSRGNSYQYDYMINGLMEQLKSASDEPAISTDKYTLQQKEGYQSLREMEIQLAKDAAELNQRILEGQLSMQDAQQEFQSKQLDLAQQSMDQLSAYLNREPSELEKKLEEVQLLQANRLESALKGELPVSEATTSAYEKEKEQLANVMSQKLGPDWEETTSGIQAKNEFEKNWQVVFDQERRGEIAQGTGAFYQGVGLSAGLESQRYNQLAGTSGYTPTGLLNVSSPYNNVFNTASGVSGMYGGVMAGAGNLQKYYTDERYNRAALNAGQSSGKMSGVLGGAMAGATALAGLPIPGLGFLTGIGGGLLGAGIGYLLS